MRYGSVCSGIEAASVAWRPLGWKAAFLSEIEAFPRSVLKHHYPDVPLHGDFTTIKRGQYDPIELLVGGTPCQSFSVAGLRGGLDDDRGNLALEFLRLADRLRPRWLVWENVPGVLSSGGGRDFGSILGGMAELGYGFAYRVLDAQHVRVSSHLRAVPQRRRRVFVVGCLGDWRRASSVLLEPESLRGDSAPRREAGKGVAPTISARPSGGGGLGTGFDLDGGLIAANSTGNGFWVDADAAATVRSGDDRGGGGARESTLVASTGDVSHCLNAGGMGRIDYETETMVVHTLKADGFDASEDGTGRGTPLVAFGWQNSAHQGISDSSEISPTLDKSKTPAVAFGINGAPDVSHCLRSGASKADKHESTTYVVASPYVVRRLTPTECERLQGFPDGYTAVPHRGKPAADGPRYKALGNSMAVNCMAWIGERIAKVDAMQEAYARAAE